MQKVQYFLRSPCVCFFSPQETTQWNGFRRRLTKQDCYLCRTKMGCFL